MLEELVFFADDELCSPPPSSSPPEQERVNAKASPRAIFFNAMSTSVNSGYSPYSSIFCNNIVISLLPLQNFIYREASPAIYYIPSHDE
jgi:hypothetical protein